MNIKNKLEDAGISLYNFKGFITKDEVMDADNGTPISITNANIGVPAELLSYFDPQAIEALTAPRNATILFPEVAKGDWTSEKLKFRIEEKTGSIAPYGDYSDAGNSNINDEWISTDVFRMQTMLKYGDLEVAKKATAKIDLIASEQRAASNTINLYGNRYYMYGVNGLNIFGIVNHPLLPAALIPATVGGQTSWAAKSADAIYDDINSIVGNLQDKTQGLIDTNIKGKLALSPVLMKSLTKRNSYGVSVIDMVKKSFPNLQVVGVPEFATASGDYAFVIADELRGIPVGECTTSQKMRTFNLIQDVSSWKQKAASATSGFVLKMPLGIARMLVA